MLWDASAILGYSIEARDGSLGTVNDFLFSDDSWRIRWLVVDTGNWLSGRKVLLHPSALGQPDPALRQFPVNLTKRQVKGSPDISTDQPVSRQMESYLYDSTAGILIGPAAISVLARLRPRSSCRSIRQRPNCATPALSTFNRKMTIHTFAASKQSLGITFMQSTVRLAMLKI